MTQTPTAVLPHTLRFQSIANRIVRAMLRTPLICRLASRRLVTVYVIGRNSGARYNIPTAYAADGPALLIGTSFGWARNLRSGEPVDIRFKGKRRTADVEVLIDEAEVVSCYHTIVHGNHQFAKFNKIGFDDAGQPDAADVHRAWASGARAIRLTPR
jgi:uncharacterized protein YcsI (UPF0317 family)